MLVPNIADELFEDILHRYYSERTAVFVGDDGHVCLGLLQGFEQSAYPDAGRHIHGLRHDGGKATFTNA